MVIIFCFFLLSLHFAFFPTCDSYKCYGVTVLRCYAFAECSEPWFVGKDVAEALGYTNPQKAIRDHVDEDGKLTERIVLSGQNREVVIINESGLNSFILSSKQPFKHYLLVRDTDALCRTPHTQRGVAVHHPFNRPHFLQK